MAEYLETMVLFVAASVVLYIPSRLVWRVLDAVAYRFTKDDDGERPTNLLFFFVMVSAAAIWAYTHPGILNGGELHGQNLWSAFLFLYCLGASGLMLIKLASSFMRFLWGALIVGIRGD